MTRRPPSPTLFPYPTLSRSLAPGEDHLRFVAQLLGKMAEIIRIDPDAVPADKTRLEAEEVPFGPCRGEHVPHRHADLGEDLRHLVDEGDVDVALSVLDRLGCFGRLDRCGAEHTAA